MLSKDFAHDMGSTANKPPLNIEWCFFTYDNPISVYLHSDVYKGIEDPKDRIKFLWLLESRQFDANALNIIKDNLDVVLDTYEQIWTHNQELLNLSPKFKWTPAYGSFIRELDIYYKTKVVSMITSSKAHTPQQVIRYNYAHDNRDKIDVYGIGFNYIPYKEEGLKDYMFSVCIENDTYDTYFTEKVLDCFATGTIPIYMGTRRITEHFNENGIIFLDDDFDVSKLNRELYYSKMVAVIDNFNRVQKYSVLDDWIYENHLKDFKPEPVVYENHSEDPKPEPEVRTYHSPAFRPIERFSNRWRLSRRR